MLGLRQFRDVVAGIFERDQLDVGATMTGAHSLGMLAQAPSTKRTHNPIAGIQLISIADQTLRDISRRTKSLQSGFSIAYWANKRVASRAANRVRL